MTSLLTVRLVLSFLSAGILSTLAAHFPENANAEAAEDSWMVPVWNVAPGQWPWQVYLRTYSRQKQVSSCAGSIIHEQWVITAAHCTAHKRHILVLAGGVDRLKPKYSSKAKLWWRHPLYNDAFSHASQPHDLALLKLRDRIRFSRYIQPIRLQRSKDMGSDYKGRVMAISGWRLNMLNGGKHDKLSWMFLTAQSSRDCGVACPRQPLVSSTLCATYNNVPALAATLAASAGDSGSSLIVLERDGNNTLVGVSSFGSAACDFEYETGVFVQPGYYHAWISEVTRIDFDWDFEPQQTGNPPSPSATVSDSSNERTTYSPKPKATQNPSRCSILDFDSD